MPPKKPAKPATKNHAPKKATAGAKAKPAAEVTKPAATKAKPAAAARPVIRAWPIDALGVDAVIRMEARIELDGEQRDVVLELDYTRADGPLDELTQAIDDIYPAVEQGAREEAAEADAEAKAFRKAHGYDRK